MDTRPLPRHQAKPVRRHLIRAAIAGAVAIAGMVVATQLGQLHRIHGHPPDPATPVEKAILFIGAVVLLVAGVASVRGVSAAIKAQLQPHLSAARSAPLALLVQVLGYAIVLILVLQVFNAPLGGLLFGGALTGVIIGIAAQQTLGNFFAGVVLLIVRPFTIGERVYLRSTIGEYEGVVTDMSMFYVTVNVDRGPVSLPNSSVLASAVGPGARSDDPKEPPAAPPPERPAAP